MENNIFCFAVLTDKEMGMVYTNTMGVLPIMSLDGKQYYILMYDYDNNYVNALPVSDLHSVTIVVGVKIFEDMIKKGHSPTH